jgi:hypothetical protein
MIRRFFFVLEPLMQDREIVHPKLRHLPIELRLNPDRNAVIGGLLLLSILPIIFISIITVVILVIHRKLSTCGVLVLESLVTLSVTHVFRLSRRYLADPQRNLRNDLRDPVLYLRSFDHDLSSSSRTFDKQTPEEQLTDVLNRLGPVLALGRPGEKGLPLPGAIRVYVMDSNWQPVVEYLMAASTYVVISAGIGRSLIWELRTAKRVVDPERLLISFLHWRLYSPFVHQQIHEQFSSYFEEIFGRGLPFNDRLVALIYFDADWNPHPIEIIFENTAPILTSLFYDLSTPSWGIEAALVPLLTKRELLKSE